MQVAEIDSSVFVGAGPLKRADHVSKLNALLHAKAVERDRIWGAIIWRMLPFAR